MKMIFGTKEWAGSNENIMQGCKHDCKYCYAKAMSPRHKTINISRWDKPIIREDYLAKGIGKRKKTIMFPSTHDLHEEHLCYIIPFLEKLLSPGNNVLIVSKPHPEVIRTICNSFPQYKDQILFRFTIGSGYDRVLKFWEPGAPTFEERGSALIYAWDSGFQTSISCEPMLDEYIGDVIYALKGFVTDAIWLGKMNDPTRRLKINGHSNIPEEFKEGIRYWMNDDNIWTLYYRYKEDPMIKWKESIKKIVGLDLATEKGLDV